MSEAEPKIHLVVQSRWRFGNTPADWITICPVIQSERVNPDTTTRVGSEVTCEHCLRKLARRDKEERE